MLLGNFIKDNSEFLKHINLEATRIVTEIRGNSSIIILYSEVGLENLQSRRNKHNQILFYKKINDLAPEYMLDSIQSYFSTYLTCI